jgi:hypothetical protein
LLECITEFRETFKCVFIMKATTREQPDERDTQGKVSGSGTELPCPLELSHPASVQILRSLSPPFLSLYGDFIP